MNAYRSFHSRTSYLRDRPPSVRPVPACPDPPQGGIPLPWAPPAPADLFDVLQARRCQRAFTGEPLPLLRLGQWLCAALGPSGEPLGGQVRRRAYPSAGALYPDRVYVVALRVEGLEAGVYRYHPLENTLAPVAPGAGPDEALNLAHEPDLARAAVAVFITARLERAVEKYGDRAYRFALQESGHMAQNLLLGAAALGMRATVLGSFLEDASAELLGLPPDELVLYALLAGPARPDPGLDEAAVPAPQPWWQWRLYADDPFRGLSEVRGRLLEPLEREGLIEGHWFMLKSDGGPHVRLRLRPSDLAEAGEVAARLERGLADLETQGLFRAVPTVYEPEEGLFGGRAALEATHRMFCADARVALAAHALGGPDRYLASHLWSELMLRALGLDAFEQWDVWRRVRTLRPGSVEGLEERVRRLAGVLQQLHLQPDEALEASFRRLVPCAQEALAGLRAWGQALQGLNREGRLERGLRGIAAACTLFHWNRMAFAWLEHLLIAEARYRSTRPE